MPAAGLPVASITTSTRSSPQASRPSLDKTRARDAALIPADAAACRLRALGVEIGDHRDLEAGDRRHLRQEHRAELAGADQAGADRPAGINACGEKRLQVHALLTSRFRNPETRKA